MDKRIFIDRNYKEGLGKYFLKKAVDFAFDGSFGKSYEFLKEGLDVLTCDCNGGGWRKRFKESDKTLFTDLLIDCPVHYEYYFVKAYILSFEDDKKYLYLGLDAIDNYLKSTKDEYGLYVKGKIFLSLEDYNQAYETFQEAAEITTNARLLYRMGRTKEQYLNAYGLEDLYNSFNQNPSSVCCARVLKKYMRENGIEFPLKMNESNKLLISFANSEDEFKFDSLFEKYLNKLYLDDDMPFPTEETLPVITEFINQLRLNSGLFQTENDNEYDDDYDSNDYYEKPDYERDNFYALTDGQYGDYDDWREEGGDMDSLRDGLGY
jgi:hypothetical protein